MPKVPTVQKIKLSDLRQCADNPRKISASALDLLKDSIRRDPEFMRLRPIVIDGAGMILGGNQRHKALLALGMTEIPAEWVVRADNLTNEQRRRFVIVDNGPEGMSGEWDFEALSLKWDDFPLEELGLEVPELEEIEAIGQTSTDRDGQKFGSPWGQVKQSEFVKVVIGDMETRLASQIANEIKSRCLAEYDRRGVPVNETFAAIMEAALNANSDS